MAKPTSQSSVAQVKESSKFDDFREYYGQLKSQANMLADHVRTSTYQRAILENISDFKDKVVLDVGTGSGILALFAAQAGAKRVYAVEASKMSKFAAELIEANGFKDTIIVVEGKLEQITLPEQVDVIISEPIGVLLVHERMIETYITARNKFLKLHSSSKRTKKSYPELAVGAAERGKMFPTTSSIVMCPFTDEILYQMQEDKASFWNQKNFHGIDLTRIHDAARDEHFSQAIVGLIPPHVLVASPQNLKTFNFVSCELDELLDINMHFDFVVLKTCLVHGIAGWFASGFVGSLSTVVLDTAPSQPPTHWQQVRFLLPRPIAANVGQKLKGCFRMRVNKSCSYDCELQIKLDGSTPPVLVTAKYALGDQLYHVATNFQAQ